MDCRIIEPLVFGDYPQAVKKNVGSRLPSFTKVQSEAIRGTIDFIGINHYYSIYVNDRPLEKGIRDFALDISAEYRGKTIRWLIHDYHLLLIILLYPWVFYHLLICLELICNATKLSSQMVHLTKQFSGAGSRTDPPIGQVKFLVDNYSETLMTSPVSDIMLCS